MFRIASPKAIASTTLACAVLLSTPARAGFTAPYTPPWRGAPNTEFAGWESFTSAVGGANLPDVAGSTTDDASLVQLDPAVFLTGGNLYSFSTAIDCRLSNTAPLDARRVALQTSTKGNELDYATVSLVYVDALGVEHTLPWDNHLELARIAGVGFEVESLFEWDLGPVADTIGQFELRFHGAQPSVSLDALLLDVEHAPAPSTYCTAKTNSVGCTPSIGSTGTPSASAPSGFVIHATDVLNQKSGLFFYSQHGKQAVPFQGGTLCVKAPLKRTSVQSSGGNPPPNDCSGAFALDFNAYIHSGADPALGAGDSVQGQWWYRDPGFSPPNNTGFSNAIDIVIG
ncbi:MAG: hypothetical protein HZA52_12635 [Planctomycetes bacterium]|nr:hypothetical protein [Planctomycetota bacterium]